MGRPKQLLPLAGKPVLVRTIEAFKKCPRVREIVVVTPPENQDVLRGYFSDLIYALPGVTRLASVQSGLACVSAQAGLVAIHDGVRPLLSADFLAELFRAAAHAEAVVPALPPVESLREVLGAGASRAVDRSRFVSVQTPQVFRSTLIKAAYAQPYATTFTDDASVAEAAGIKISLCEGRRENIKITTPEDLALAQSIISRLQGNL